MSELYRTLVFLKTLPPIPTRSQFHYFCLSSIFEIQTIYINICNSMCVCVCVYKIWCVYTHTYVHSGNNSISVLEDLPSFLFFRASSIVWMCHILFNNFPICIRFFAVIYSKKQCTVHCGYVFSYCLNCVIKGHFRSRISWCKSNVILLDTNMSPKYGKQCHQITLVGMIVNHSFLKTSRLRGEVIQHIYKLNNSTNINCPYWGLKSPR